MLITSSLLQPHAHYRFTSYIVYQISPTCFGVIYTILKENFIYLVRTRKHSGKIHNTSSVKWLEAFGGWGWGWGWGDPDMEE